MLKLHVNSAGIDIVYLSEIYIVSMIPVTSPYTKSAITMTNGETFRVKETLEEISDALKQGDSNTDSV